MPENHETSRKEEGKKDHDAATGLTPSVTVSVFGCWILPVLLIATLTRFVTETEPMPPVIPKSVPVDFGSGAVPTSIPTHTPTTTTDGKSRKKGADDVEMPAMLRNKPESYQEVVKAIQRRRLDWENTDSNPMEGFDRPTRSTSPKTEPRQQEHQQSQQKEEPEFSQVRGLSSDPVRLGLLEQIDEYRRAYSESNKQDLYKSIDLADALRAYDLKFHDGGSSQAEAIQTYLEAIEMGKVRRQEQVDAGEEVTRSARGTNDVNEEVSMDYPSRSPDGLLCGLYTALGKTYFMANMFEKAVESYNQAIDLAPLYLDAVSSRGSSRLILGDYAGAAQDFTSVIEHDKRRMFQDVYTGLARVLQANESVAPDGWELVTTKLNEVIPALENQLDSVDSSDVRAMLSSALNRFYHVLFVYHDVKTKDVNEAWNALSKSYEFKMRNLPPYNKGFEAQKIAATKQIFHRGFWPENVGSSSTIPIFIIGFVRSGSTLLERVLDAHPQIVGTGENSVFNGRLDDIRNMIVQTSMSSDSSALSKVIEDLADGVVAEMKERWLMVASGENRAESKLEPKRYVDKMLTNYFNVGFIHMLFPNALILHVAREPMDSIFSAYKHEFPSGPLDYTSDFTGLSEYYHGYRDLMEHWDKELPGRIKHVRYEDMVNDMPGVAKKIIEATGLEWDESVLDFHKKKHAVNTLSTTQVRKGVYKDGLQAWKKYEKQLQPLADMVGERTTYDLKTTVGAFSPPAASQQDGEL